MISRRHFVQAAMATTALYGASGFGNWSRLAAQQVLSQDDLIGSSDFGNVSLIHITDMHAQTQPIYFREPEFNIGVGLAEGQPPHLVGADFRAAYGIEQGSAMDYALTYDDFVALARAYGRMGGLDRVATVVKRSGPTGPTRWCSMAATPGRARYTALKTGGRTWSRDERARRRRDDLALGIHAGHRPGHRDVDELPSRLPRRQHLRRRMGRAGLRALPRFSSAAACRSA
jgi:sulfur-oxidizing protein SoxB